MEEAQSQSSVDSSQQQTPPSELDVWIHTVGGKKKGRVYGLGLESTALTGPSKFQGQSSSAFQWLNSEEFQEQVRKQVETEVNARVQAAEQERDELRRRMDENERKLQHTQQMMQEILANIKFPLSATPSMAVFSSQTNDMDPYERYEAQRDIEGRGEDNDEEDEGEDEDEEE